VTAPRRPTEAERRVGEMVGFAGRPSSDRPGMQLLKWRRLRRSTLRGFGSFRMPSGFRVYDCPAHTKNGKHWVSLPSRAQVENGALKFDVNGKVLYAPVVEWESKELRDGFSQRAVALILAHDAGAFDPDIGGEPER
jgi:hypothetical protein